MRLVNREVGGEWGVDRVLNPFISPSSRVGKEGGEEGIVIKWKKE